MSLSEIEIVQNYVALHNLGVRTGDYSQLMSLFTPDAEMVFEFGNLGTVRGTREISRAFRDHPPTDELVIGKQLSSGEVILFEYAWHSAPTVRAGILAFARSVDKIARLVISP